MSSYYNTIQGTLNTGQTARSSDIHLIQSSIQDAFQRALIDICGTGIVLGESEELKGQLEDFLAIFEAGDSVKETGEALIEEFEEIIARPNKTPEDYKNSLWLLKTGVFFSRLFGIENRNIR